MKILIRFDPQKKADDYEGSRLRKTLKGACESVGLIWVENLLSFPDVVHLISPQDGKFLDKAKKSGYKTVISVGYTEGDEHCRFFDYGQNRGPVLTKNSLSMLDKADLLLVPNERCKRLLEEQGVKPKIAILPGAVDLPRFDDMLELEKKSFRKYFGLKAEDRYILATADSSCQTQNFKTLSEIAKACPDIKIFTFCGTKPNGFKCPKNLYVNSLVEDDIYRSALSGAEAYLKLPNAWSDEGIILEAFAAKTQVIGYGKDSIWEIDDPNTYRVSENPEKLNKLLNDLYNSKTKNTIIQAYTAVQKHSLSETGKTLAEIYNSLLDGNKEAS